MAENYAKNHFFSFKIANFAKFSRISPKSPILEVENRGFSALGDLSPGQISDRQLEAKNRGFGDKSPDLLTLVLRKVIRNILFSCLDNNNEYNI